MIVSVREDEYKFDLETDVGVLILGEKSKCSTLVMEGAITTWFNPETTNAILKLIHEKEAIQVELEIEKDKVMATLETCDRIRAEMAREREWKGVDPIKFTETIAAAVERVVKVVKS